MQEQVYYACCAAGSPMLCVRAHLRTDTGTSAGINIEIPASMFGYLKKPDGSKYLGQLTEYCADALASPMLDSSGRMTHDIPFGDDYVIRVRFVRIGEDILRRAIQRLGEVLMMAIRQAIFNGSVLQGLEPGFSTDFEWLYTAWASQHEGQSYFLTQMHVPREVTKHRLGEFAVPLRQLVYDTLAPAQGLPVQLFLHEETPSDPIRVAGRAGNFSIEAADAVIVKLIIAAQRRAM